MCVCRLLDLMEHRPCAGSDVDPRGRDGVRDQTLVRLKYPIQLGNHVDTVEFFSRGFDPLRGGDEVAAQARAVQIADTHRELVTTAWSP